MIVVIIAPRQGGATRPDRPFLPQRRFPGHRTVCRCAGSARAEKSRLPDAHSRLATGTTARYRILRVEAELEGFGLAVSWMNLRNLARALGDLFPPAQRERVCRRNNVLYMSPCIPPKTHI